MEIRSECHSIFIDTKQNKPGSERLLRALFALMQYSDRRFPVQYGEYCFRVNNDDQPSLRVPDRGMFSSSVFKPVGSQIHLSRNGASLIVDVARSATTILKKKYAPFLLHITCASTGSSAVLYVAWPYSFLSGSVAEMLAGVVMWREGNGAGLEALAEAEALHLLAASCAMGIPPEGCVLAVQSLAEHKADFLSTLFALLHELGAGLFIPGEGISDAEFFSVCKGGTPFYQNSVLRNALDDREHIQQQLTEYLATFSQHQTRTDGSTSLQFEILSYPAWKSIANSLCLHTCLSRCLDAPREQSLAWLRNIGDCLSHVSLWREQFAIPVTLGIDLLLGSRASLHVCRDSLFFQDELVGAMQTMAALQTGEISTHAVSANLFTAVNPLVFQREEKDSLGTVSVPAFAYYGAQTKRSYENFAVSGLAMGENTFFIESLALVKRCAARANMRIGLMDEKKGTAIVQAAYEVQCGQMYGHFPVDWMQGGGGIAMNMNINEVIANRASELLGGSKGDGSVHPNDDVNMCHSTNDVVLTAMHLTILRWLEVIDGTLTSLEACLQQKSDEWSGIVKLGRTCLMDALPLTLGQQFSGYHQFVKRQKDALQALHGPCKTLGMGATGIGTGIGVAPGFLEAFFDELSKSIPGVTPEANYFDALQNTDFYLTVSGRLKTLGTGLSRIATDVRFMASGPRSGWNELVLPAVQPGSSIMPGKINPLIPELINQIGYQVCGHDTAITMAHEGGDIDLNVWEAVFLHNLCQSFMLLDNGIRLFIDKCLEDIRPRIEVCLAHAESSLALATVVSELLGYESGLAAARKAAAEHMTIKEAVLALGMLDQTSADELLDPMVLTDRETFCALLDKYRSLRRKAL